MLIPMAFGAAEGREFANVIVTLAPDPPALEGTLIVTTSVLSAVAPLRTFAALAATPMFVLAITIGSLAVVFTLLKVLYA